MLSSLMEEDCNLIVENTNRKLMTTIFGFQSLVLE